MLVFYCIKKIKENVVYLSPSIAIGRKEFILNSNKIPVQKVEDLGSRPITSKQERKIVHTWYAEMRTMCKDNAIFIRNTELEKKSNVIYKKEPVQGYLVLRPFSTNEVDTKVITQEKKNARRHKHQHLSHKL